jgi:hypothetical protein
MSEVIYARVPDTLKAAADEYANHRGTTLTSAVVDLLERGLSAVSDAPSVATLETALAETRAAKAQAEADLNATRAELTAFTAFAQRAQRPIGTCPNLACNRPINGHDLFGGGSCPGCGQALSNLIVPANGSSSLDQREVLMLLGALGAVLAVAYLASK